MLVAHPSAAHRSLRIAALPVGRTAGDAYAQFLAAIVAADFNGISTSGLAVDLASSSPTDLERGSLAVDLAIEPPALPADRSDAELFYPNRRVLRAFVGLCDGSAHGDEDSTVRAVRDFVADVARMHRHHGPPTGGDAVYRVLMFNATEQQMDLSASLGPWVRFVSQPVRGAVSGAAWEEGIGRELRVYANELFSTVVAGLDTEAALYGRPDEGVMSIVPDAAGLCAHLPPQFMGPKAGGVEVALAHGLGGFSLSATPKKRLAARLQKRRADILLQMCLPGEAGACLDKALRGLRASGDHLFMGLAEETRAAALSLRAFLSDGGGSRGRVWEPTFDSQVAAALREAVGHFDAVVATPELATLADAVTQLPLLARLRLCKYMAGAPPGKALPALASSLGVEETEVLPQWLGSVGIRVCSEYPQLRQSGAGQPEASGAGDAAAAASVTEAGRGGHRYASSGFSAGGARLADEHPAMGLASDRSAGSSASDRSAFAVPGSPSAAVLSAAVAGVGARSGLPPTAACDAAVIPHSTAAVAAEATVMRCDPLPAPSHLDACRYDRDAAAEGEERRLARLAIAATARGRSDAGSGHGLGAAGEHGGVLAGLMASTQALGVLGMGGAGGGSGTPNAAATGPGTPAGGGSAGAGASALAAADGRSDASAPCVVEATELLGFCVGKCREVKNPQVQYRLLLHCAEAYLALGLPRKAEACIARVCRIFRTLQPLIGREHLMPKQQAAADGGPSSAAAGLPFPSPLGLTSSVGGMSTPLVPPTPAAAGSGAGAGASMAAAVTPAATSRGLPAPLASPAVSTPADVAGTAPACSGCVYATTRARQYSAADLARGFGARTGSGVVPWPLAWFQNSDLNPWSSPFAFSPALAAALLTLASSCRDRSSAALLCGDGRMLSRSSAEHPLSCGGRAGSSPVYTPFAPPDGEAAARVLQPGTAPMSWLPLVMVDLWQCGELPLLLAAAAACASVDQAGTATVALPAASSALLPLARLFAERSLAAAAPSATGGAPTPAAHIRGFDSADSAASAAQAASGLFSPYTGGRPPVPQAAMQSPAPSAVATPARPAMGAGASGSSKIGRLHTPTAQDAASVRLRTRRLLCSLAASCAVLGSPLLLVRYLLQRPVICSALTPADAATVLHTLDAIAIDAVALRCHVTQHDDAAAAAVAAAPLRPLRPGHTSSASMSTEPWTAALSPSTHWSVGGAAALPRAQLPCDVAEAWPPRVGMLAALLGDPCCAVSAQICLQTSPEVLPQGESVGAGPDLAAAGSDSPHGRPWLADVVDSDALPSHFRAEMGIGGAAGATALAAGPAATAWHPAVLLQQLSEYAIMSTCELPEQRVRPGATALNALLRSGTPCVADVSLQVARRQSLGVGLGSLRRQCLVTKCLPPGLTLLSASWHSSDGAVLQSMHLEAPPPSVGSSGAGAVASPLPSPSVVSSSAAAEVGLKAGAGAVASVRSPATRSVPSPVHAALAATSLIAGYFTAAVKAKRFVMLAPDPGAPVSSTASPAADSGASDVNTLGAAVPSPTTEASRCTSDLAEIGASVRVAWPPSATAVGNDAATSTGSAARLELHSTLRNHSALAVHGHATFVVQCHIPPASAWAAQAEADVVRPHVHLIVTLPVQFDAPPHATTLLLSRMEPLPAGCSVRVAAVLLHTGPVLSIVPILRPSSAPMNPDAACQCSEACSGVWDMYLTPAPRFSGAQPAPTQALTAPTTQAPAPTAAALADQAAAQLHAALVASLLTQPVADDTLPITVYGSAWISSERLS